MRAKRRGQPDHGPRLEQALGLAKQPLRGDHADIPMTIRKASCSCGQLELTCAGEPVRVSLCHCLACQQRTGSISGVQARYRREHVTIEGTSTEHVRTGDEGSRIEMHFCPRCGSTVYWQIGGMEEFLAVAVGAFADPGFPTPTFSVYGARRHAWAVMPELDVEAWD